MQLIHFSTQAGAGLTLAVVACMFVLFLRETYSTEVVAIGGVAILLASGVLPYQQALAILANPAPWTIAAMFIVMGALVLWRRLQTLPRDKLKQIPLWRSVC